jgi:hypothetical protein
MQDNIDSSKGGRLDSNDSEANTDSASMPQPDITRTIEEILIWIANECRTASFITKNKVRVSEFDTIKAEAVQKLVTLAESEYRRGYNDNARDCYCDEVSYRGFTERVAHHHLMDDGESHPIRPELRS